MIEIDIDPIYKVKAPDLIVTAINADIVNSPTSDELWQDIVSVSENIKRDIPDISAVNKDMSILSTRNVYKSLGKDPNRYRPSAEALRRRIVKGAEIYRTLTVIDIINLVSIQSGYSIGGFDSEKISGDTLHLGVGITDEPFEAIGRGTLNISGLPVYRDDIGGIGTPTSDNERTKLTVETTKLMMIINAYDGNREKLEKTISTTLNLLKKHANSNEISINEYLP